MINQVKTKIANRRARLAHLRKYPWLPSWAYVFPEKQFHAHVEAERGELFETYNGGSTEYDVLNWLHATVMVLKPENVLETGAANGLGTIALASACRNNGFGKVHSVEIEPERCEEINRKLRDEGLETFGEVHCSDSLTFLAANKIRFEVGFYDSLCTIRAQEFATCLDKGTITQYAVFHDTSPTRCETQKEFPSPEEHAVYRAELARLGSDPRCSGYFESKLSRGFFCLFVKR